MECPLDRHSGTVYYNITILEYSQEAEVAKILRREQLEAVAGLFNVLADANRLALLQHLKEGERTVGALVSATGAKQANVSKHLAMRFGSELLQRRRSGNEVWYSIRDPMVFELCHLVCGKLQRDAEELARVLRTGQSPSSQKLRPKE